jgi:hypothetical protein
MATDSNTSRIILQARRMDGLRVIYHLRAVRSKLVRLVTERLGARVGAVRAMYTEVLDKREIEKLAE